MKNVVRLSGKTSEGVLSLDLRDILAVVGDRGVKLRWFIFGLEAVGDVTPVWPKGMLDLEERTMVEGGVEFAWQALVDLASRIDQMINGSVRGLDSAGHAKVEIVAFDSTDWTITADEETLLEALSAEDAARSGKPYSYG